MNSKIELSCLKRHAVMCMYLVMFGLPFAGRAGASTAAEKVIYNFQDSGGVLGGGPQSALIADAAGKLYGTDPGSACCGRVFELSPPTVAGGAWTETDLYLFTGQSGDGATPVGALVFDKLGNLYGTTVSGGTANLGTVYKLEPPTVPGGPWTESVLYSFLGGFETRAFNAAHPHAAVIFDSAGNLYGTTYDGGWGCYTLCGTVFELSPPAQPGAAWTEQLVISFEPSAGLGWQPLGDLVFDSSGALYGTTAYSDTGLGGTVFRLAPAKDGWTWQVIYTFNAGQPFPSAGLTFDKQGNLYGTLSGKFNSPTCACGEIFKLRAPRTAGDPWTKDTLYDFTGGKDGATPYGNVIFDAAGNLYTTAGQGGLVPPTYGNGTVVELSPPAVAGERWTETTLHDFSGTKYGDGATPIGGLLLLKGRFYGTTQSGGLNGKGIVFSLKLNP